MRPSPEKGELMEVPDRDLQRLGEAVDKAGARLECPSCGHKEWAFLERPVELPAAGGVPEGFQALPLTCKRCGFIRLHAASILDRYIDRAGG
jgi:C4-type Zn-finger protein